MKRHLTTTALKAYTEAPLAIQKAFDKQVQLLVEKPPPPLPARQEIQRG